MSRQLELESAISSVRALFPFPGYIEDEPWGIRNIISSIARYIRPGSRVLDFGSGPMDKTAVLQHMGYRCSAVDDLLDSWHLEADNRETIITFAARLGINFRLGSQLSFKPHSFDLVMMCDVLEHLHDSPRTLLNNILPLLKPDGYLFILVPNAVNLRKRIDVLRGKTNLPAFDGFYWCSSPFRGHVREYVRDDLRQLSTFLGLTLIELKSCHNMLRKLPKWLRLPFRAVTVLFPGWRDSWILVAQKPVGWMPRPTLSGDSYRTVVANEFGRSAARFEGAEDLAKLGH